MDEPPGTEYFTIQGTPGPAFMINNSRMSAGNFVIPGPSYGQNTSSKPIISDKLRDKYDKYVIKILSSFVVNTCIIYETPDLEVREWMMVINTKIIVKTIVGEIEMTVITMIGYEFS